MERTSEAIAAIARLREAGCQPVVMTSKKRFVGMIGPVDNDALAALFEVDELRLGAQISWNMVVIDCDSEEAINKIPHAARSTFTVKTPKGAHYYFRLRPGQQPVPGRIIRAEPDIDVLGSDSYAMFPPSNGYVAVGSALLEYPAELDHLLGVRMGVQLLSPLIEQASADRNYIPRRQIFPRL